MADHCLQRIILDARVDARVGQVVPGDLRLN